MWAYESVFYQIYPLGMCGCPRENDGVLEHRILKVTDWIPHLNKLGIDAVYFSPVFESDTHGYNTRDYSKIDVRLGTNDDFKKVCDTLHAAGIKVIIDGVFNHVGRGFFGFQDVLKNRESSSYRDWFYLDFGGNSAYGDGLYYEGWEGNYDLVKLNLDNPSVSDYLINCVKGWIDEFGIDGLRLDVAYMVNRNFLKRLRYETSQWKDDFFLLGEMLHGDYKQIANDEMCHVTTNYECYKGIYSALNSDNLFEIVHSLLRQYGPEEWTLYKGMHHVAFVDNHDVTRIATILKDERLLLPAYAIMYGMPGIPMTYYGSEWGVKGDKAQGDDSLRPAIDAPQWNKLCDQIAKMSQAVHENKALSYGGFTSLLLENKHCVFERQYNEERMLIAINLDEGEYTAHFDARAGKGYDYISDQDVDFGGGLKIPGMSAMMIRPER